MRGGLRLPKPIPIYVQTPQQAGLFGRRNMTTTVLIVDDDPTQRRIMETVLSKLGYRTTTAGGGEGHGQGTLGPGDAYVGQAPFPPPSPGAGGGSGNGTPGDRWSVPSRSSGPAHSRQGGVQDFHS